ncbi:hypothetical protein Q4O60_16955 [Aeribacillus pallidus]|nr:hypothetical protein [Aeribacillus pallidus]
MDTISPSGFYGMQSPYTVALRHTFNFQLLSVVENYYSIVGMMFRKNANGRSTI